MAGDLDLAFWTAERGLSPLQGSVDPVSVASELGKLPQVHFAGADDDTVGPAVTRAFMARLPRKNRARMIVVPGFTHYCCWARDWPRLEREALAIAP